MKSYEVLRRSFKKAGCKKVAADTGLSLSLIHQWSRGQNGRSEARNPLDLVVLLLVITQDVRLVQWLCAQADGFFVPNAVAMSPAGKKSSGKMDLKDAGLALVHDIGEFEVALTDAPEPSSPAARAEKLRACWDRLKADGERLVRLLEMNATGRQLALFIGYAKKITK